MNRRVKIGLLLLGAVAVFTLASQFTSADTLDNSNVVHKTQYVVVSDTKREVVCTLTEHIANKSLSAFGQRDTVATYSQAVPLMLKKPPRQPVTNTVVSRLPESVQHTTVTTTVAKNEVGWYQF